MRIIVTLLFFFSASIVLAQNKTFKQLPSGHLIEPKQNLKHLSNRSMQLLWSDDVSSSGNWTFTNQSTNSNNNWYILNTPNSIPVSSLSPFASPTASNGYLMISSDSIMNGTADYDGDSLYVYAEISQSIDVSSYSNVWLEFYHNFQWDFDTRRVEVSTDNGTTWVVAKEFSNRNQIVDTTANNVNPAFTSIDLTPYVIGSTQMKVRFFYSDNDRWASYWAIDDVSIKNQPDNDLAIDEGYITTTGAYGLPVNYTFIPPYQLRPLSFYAKVNNLGSNDQPNTRVEVQMSSMVDSCLDTSALGYNCVAGTTYDSLVFNQTCNLSYVSGARNFNFSVFSDSIDGSLIDNSKTIPLSISFYNKYRRDQGGIEYGYYNNGMNFEIGNIFDTESILSVCEISFVIHPLTEVSSGGDIVYGVIYSVDSSGIIDPYAYTNEYAIDPYFSPGEIVGLSFPNGQEIQLNSNSTYLVVIGYYGNSSPTSNGFIIGASGKSTYGTSFFSSNIQYDSILTDWYTLEYTPMVWMNESDGWCYESIDERNNYLDLKQSYPNPANSEVTIEYSLKTSEEINFEIRDVIGKLIFSKNLGNRASGLNRFSLDVSNYESGIYFYSISNGASKVAKSMSIVR